MKFFILCAAPLGSDQELNEKLSPKTEVLQKNKPNLAEKEMQSNETEKIENNEIVKCRIIDRSQFCLPSVKELAKQFTKEDNKEIKPSSSSSQTKLSSKHKIQKTGANDYPQFPEELEVDYSTVPVSEIIVHLQKAANAPLQENHQKDNLYKHPETTTRMEICRKVESKMIIENSLDNGGGFDKIETVRFNGKEVHSLTARSISREFREGLKNNRYQKNYQKIDRSNSGGETDHGDMVSDRMKSSPTPSIDLKNMKKFWEEIITANSNSTKQK